MRQNKLIKRHKHGIYAGLSEERNKKARREKQEAKDKRKNCPGKGSIALCYFKRFISSQQPASAEDMKIVPRLHRRDAKISVKIPIDERSVRNCAPR
jgi:hypothetical protein